MDWTQYVRTLCRKPGAAEHTLFFSAIPLPWQSYLSQTRGQERKSALQLLDDIVRDGNAEFCVDILTLAQQNGRSDVDSVKQCYYSLLKEGKTPEPLDLLSQVPTLNYNPDISVYDGLTGGEANAEIELPAGLTREYMENLDFITAKENLIFMGAVGTGKTHLAAAIALKACQERHRIRFFTAASLANILLERNNKGTLNGFMTSLKKVELIVIDELGFVPLHKDAAQLMFQVISESMSARALS